VGNNGVGVTGINWEVTLLPVKFLSAQGSGSAAGSIAAVRYATRMGAKVMSNSWGGGGASEILKTAIQEARDAGILFVAAAGNDGRDNDTTATYPANYDVSNVVSVGAMDAGAAWRQRQTMV
jgi:subtilisin family serine protease